MNLYDILVHTVFLCKPPFDSCVAMMDNIDFGIPYKQKF